MKGTTNNNTFDLVSSDNAYHFFESINRACTEIDVALEIAKLLNKESLITQELQAIGETLFCLETRLKPTVTLLDTVPDRFHP